MENKTTQVGMGFFGWLQLAFIVLKLVGVINWSWWVVLIPLWAFLAIIVIAILLLVINAIID